MGGTPVETVANAWEDAKSTAANSVPKVRNFLDGAIKNPARIYTGVVAEPVSTAYEGSKEATDYMTQQAMKNAPKMEAAPDMPQEDPNAGPRRTVGRGRASTILNGAGGASGTPNTARRTLLGA